MRYRLYVISVLEPLLALFHLYRCKLLNLGQFLLRPRFQFLTRFLKISHIVLNLMLYLLTSHLHKTLFILQVLLYYILLLVFPRHKFLDLVVVYILSLFPDVFRLFLLYLVLIQTHILFPVRF